MKTPATRCGHRPAIFLSTTAITWNGSAVGRMHRSVCLACGETLLRRETIATSPNDTRGTHAV